MGRQEKRCGFFCLKMFGTFCKKKEGLEFRFGVQYFLAIKLAFGGFGSDPRRRGYIFLYKSSFLNTRNIFLVMGDGKHFLPKLTCITGSSFPTLNIFRRPSTSWQNEDEEITKGK